MRTQLLTHTGASGRTIGIVNRIAPAGFLLPLAFGSFDRL